MKILSLAFVLSLAVCPLAQVQEELPDPEAGIPMAELSQPEAESSFMRLASAYLKTLGWALVGSVAMGLGLIIALTIFTVMTRKVDEWELIKQGNIPIAIILGAVVIGTSIVIAVIAKQ